MHVLQAYSVPILPTGNTTYQLLSRAQSYQENKHTLNDLHCPVRCWRTREHPPEHRANQLPSRQPKQFLWQLPHTCSMSRLSRCPAPAKTPPPSSPPIKINTKHRRFPAENITRRPCLTRECMFNQNRPLPTDTFFLDWVSGVISSILFSQKTVVFRYVSNNRE